MQEIVDYNTRAEMEIRVNGQRAQLDFLIEFFIKFFFQLDWTSFKEVQVMVSGGLWKLYKEWDARIIISSNFRFHFLIRLSILMILSSQTNSVSVDSTNIRRINADKFLSGKALSGFDFICFIKM